MKKYIIFLLLSIIADILNAQISMNSGGSYQQNFNNLATTGTSNTWGNNTTISGWYAQIGLSNISVYRSSDGSALNSALYSFGTVSNNERSLGSINGSGVSPSLSNNYAYGLLMVNNTGSTINQVNVGYTMEQWANAGVNVPQNLTFWYKISTTAITNLEASRTNGWIQVNSLTAVSPTFSTTISALNGNDNANRVVVSPQQISGISIPNGHFIMLRWVDRDESNRDHGLSIDDVSVSWNTDVNYYLDADNDGYGNINNFIMSSSPVAGYVLNSSDCDDNNAAINPNTVWYRDLDNDGFGDLNTTTTSCTQPAAYVLNSLDCNDNNANINPNTIWYYDQDNDGFGNLNVTTTSCVQPANYVANSLDCNDNNANINPNTTWYRDADNDGFGDNGTTSVSCSQPIGFVSNNLDCNDANNLINPNTTWYRDQDGDSFGTPSVTTNSCTQPVGFVPNNLDCNDNNNVINPNTIWYRDIDGDGFGDPNVTTTSCTQPVGYVLTSSQSAYSMSATGSYTQNFNTLGNSGTSVSWLNNSTIQFWYAQLGSTATISSYRVNNGSNLVAGLRSYGVDGNSDRALGSINGSSSSASNNYAYGVLLQNNSELTINSLQISYVLEQWNINSNVNSQPMTVWYSIQNAPILTPQASINAGWTQVTGLNTSTPQTGSTFSTLNGNLTTNRSARNNISVSNFNLLPGQYVMIRWLDSDASGTDHGIGIDDVQISWEALLTSYQDADGDGFGNPAVSNVSSSIPAGYVLNNTDCNDGNAAINPNTVWYRDADADGFGNSGVTSVSCSQPSGFVSNNTDCNDESASINPNTVWYSDADGDGFGNPSVTSASCTQPSGYVSNNSDCNDASASINPNTVWFRDLDGDGFGSPTQSSVSCTQPSGYVLNNSDCDDYDELINPTLVWYQDADGDGYGNPSSSSSSCTQPIGYVPNNEDCNDANASLNPLTIWYIDQDNDGFGSSSISTVSCTQPEGYVANNEDCNDDHAATGNTSTLSSPTSVSGLKNGICSLASPYTYSVPSILGASSYSWIVPSGMTILSGQNTNSITVSFDETFASGQLRVRANNVCSSSDYFDVALDTTMLMSANIYGTRVICTSGTQEEYTTDEIEGATSYNWTAPTGVTIISGQGTRTILVETDANFESGPIRVNGVNDCTIGPILSYWIYTQPRQPNNIQGISAGVCAAANSSMTYTLTTNPSAYSYTWTVPSGMTIASGQGTNTIEVSLSGSNFDGTLISVVANNPCGTSSPRNLTLSSTPSRPGTITGPTTGICSVGNNAPSYSIANVSNATSYVWTTPTGMTISSGQGTTTINTSVNGSFTSGSVSVYSSNACAISGTRTISLASSPTSIPSALNTYSNICPSTASEFTYTTSTVAGATSYTWGFANINVKNAAITDPAIYGISGQGTTSFTIGTTTNLNSAGINVRATNACGSSGMRQISQSTAPSTPVITGTAAPCGTTEYIGSGNSPSNAYTYQWFVPTGMTINSGQGTTTLNTTVSSNISGSLILRATNTCGSAQRTMAISTTGCTGAREYIETINEITELTNLSVYPNPTNESVNIEINSTEFNQAEISILNLNGSILQATSNRIKDEMLQTSFDLSALPSGVYFVKVVFENGISKVVKVQKI